MTAPPAEVAVGSYLIVPYRWDRGDPAKNETILAHCSTIANLFPLPTDEAERKVIVAQTLTDPNNYAWECWKKVPLQSMTLVGIISLTRVTPKLDALGHFVFFDRHLVGKRPLCQTVLTWCFEQLELRRISVEIPDHLEPLIRFVRKLGFRYEGEPLAAKHPLTDAIASKGINNAPQWLAHWGSRRERMHCDSDGVWHDTVCLRLLKEDHVVK